MIPDGILDNLISVSPDLVKAEKEMYLVLQRVYKKIKQIQNKQLPGIDSSDVCQSRSTRSAGLHEEVRAQVTGAHTLHFRRVAVLHGHRDQCACAFRQITAPISEHTTIENSQFQ